MYQCKSVRICDRVTILREDVFVFDFRKDLFVNFLVLVLCLPGGMIHLFLIRFDVVTGRERNSKMLDWIETMAYWIETLLSIQYTSGSDGWIVLILMSLWL